MAMAKTTERQAGILLLLLQPIAENPDAAPDQTWVGEERLRGVDQRLWIVGRLINRRLAMRRQDETGRYSYRLTASGILLARKIKKEAGF